MKKNAINPVAVGPKIKEIEKTIFSPKVRKQSNLSPEILQISNEDNLTKIEFIYYAKSYYANGGWVQMNKECFIRPVGSDLRYKLVSAVNIPITPQKHWFKTEKDILCYTLYFPPLPKGTKSIDIIEFEGPGGNWFNFYGVSMEKVRTEKLIVGN